MSQLWVAVCGQEVVKVRVSHGSVGRAVLGRLISFLVIYLSLSSLCGVPI